MKHRGVWALLCLLLAAALLAGCAAQTISDHFAVCARFAE